MAEKNIDVRFKLIDEFTGSFTKALASLTNGTKSAQRAWKSVEKAGKSISSVGADMTRSITLPIVGAAGASLKYASDFENGIAKVSTIYDATQMTMEQLRQGTKDLSKETGVSVDQISEAQYNAISAGAETSKSFSLVGTAIKAAKAGFTDATTAIDGLTTAYNAYQGSVDYQALSDQMLATQNYGKTTFGDLAQSMGTVMPVASSLNVQTQDLFASIGVLTRNGIDTATATTNMRAALSGILKPTKDVTAAAKSMGIDFSAAHLQSVGWTQFLQEIHDKTGGASDKMAKLFPNVRALTGMTVLAGKGFESYGSALDYVNGSTGLTQQSFEKMLTPSEKLQIALNKLKVDAVGVGEKLLPFAEKAIGYIDKLATAWSNMSPKQQDNILKWAGIAAAAGPVLSILGKAVSVVGGVGKGFNAFAGFASKATSGMKVASAGAKGFQVVIAGLTSPIGVVMLGIAALIAIVASCRAHWDSMKKALQASGVFQSLKANFQKLKTDIQPIISVVTKVGSTFTKIFSGVIAAAVTGAIVLFGGLLNGVVEAIDGIVNIITGLGKAITSAVNGDISGALDGMKQVFQGVGDFIKGIIDGIVGTIKSIADAIQSIHLPTWGDPKGHSYTVTEARAIGDNNWKGGPVRVHEEGGEIIDLPHGTRIYPHDKSIAMARASGGSSFNIAKLADSIVVREDADIDKIADALVRKLRVAAGNMGGVPNATLA